MSKYKQKVPMTIKIDPDVKQGCADKARLNGLNLSEVGRQLWAAWLSGQINVHSAVKVTEIKEAE